ncbi:LacI family DNA-binding transcriptional regulator [Pedobacter sp. ASV28]|uniref:LacI family DNA-binding transcriptional regulator n=1 Tax=Pedobacter sp. ASV28 TaxID=2795123 RepID=UPI0018ED617E|nr:LacI family DNA-binding transcriptional regulator [Pedobacter sp. ASV28]
MNNKEVTIYDIADKLAISAATVSRALQDHPAVNKKTKQRINELAIELGYRSNKFASNLRTKRTNTLGLIVPRLNSLFMSSVISGIEKVANGAGYNLIISQSFEQELKEKTNAITMFNNRVDALIVSLAADTSDYAHFESFMKKNIPIVFFDRVPEQIDTTKVLIDNFAAGYKATQHLIEQGYRLIVHITGNRMRNVYRERFEGYRQALADAHLPFDEDMVISNDLSEQAIQEAIEHNLLKREKLPDALFISNDSSAAFALSILKGKGLRIPEDMAIVGFNNDLISKVTEPPITTIHYPGIEMGESIARILIDYLNGQGDLSFTSKIFLETELVVRGSSVKDISALT